MGSRSNLEKDGKGSSSKLQKASKLHDDYVQFKSAMYLIEISSEC